MTSFSSSGNSKLALNQLAKMKIEKIYPQAAPFEVLYNPEEYTLSKDNNFASQTIPGLSSPLLQFINGNLRTLEMELFFDTYDTPTIDKKDVRSETEKVVSLMNIDSETHAPPVLKVTWASLQFTCVLAKVSQKFLMFTDQGKPVRARLTVTFNEFVTPEVQAQETPTFSADLSKVHVVGQGDLVSTLAAKYYDDPQAWRPIAIANHLDDPRVLAVGQALRIPALPFNDPESGDVLR